MDMKAVCLANMLAIVALNMHSTPISLSADLWQAIFRLAMRTHGRTCLIPALTVDKTLSVCSLFPVSASISVSPTYQTILKPLVWEELHLHPTQLSHLVKDICHNPASTYPACIREWTRKIRFIADVPQPWILEAAALILLYARDLKRVYADHTTFGTSFVSLVSIRHSHTIQQLMLRVSVSHDVTTFLIDQFPFLHGLGLIFEAGVPYQPVADTLRPLGLAPKSLSRLICLHIELSHDLGLYGAQHASVLRMLTHSRLPALCTMNIVMQNIPSASEAVKAIRQIMDNHSATLGTVHFDLPPVVLKALLPKLALHTVFLRQYDGRIPLGAYTSLHIRHLSIGSYSNPDKFSFKHSLALQDMLLSIYSRLLAAAAAGRLPPLQTIQLCELSWIHSSHRNYAATPMGSMPVFARAFHDLGVRLLDENECEMRYVDQSCGP
jgi:hypothetical protein